MRKPGYYWVWDDSDPEYFPPQWRILEWAAEYKTKHRTFPARWLYDTEEEPWVKEENVGPYIEYPDAPV